METEVPWRLYMYIFLINSYVIYVQDSIHLKINTVNYNIKPPSLPTKFDFGTPKKIVIR